MNTRDSSKFTFGNKDITPRSPTQFIRNYLYGKTESILTLTMPSGIISKEGTNKIKRLLHKDIGLPSLPRYWDWEWVVQKGPYAGTLPKRISAYYWKNFQININPADLSQIGNIAQLHTLNSGEYPFDLTKNLSWTPGTFGEDENSCFWNSRNAARYIMQENDVLAVRFYRTNNPNTKNPGTNNPWNYEGFASETAKGFARGWLVPDYPTNGSAVLFNVYGMWPTRAARIISQFLGLSYAPITLDNHGSTNGMIYINEGKGFLLATPDILSKNKHVSLELNSPDYPIGECTACQKDVYAYNFRDFKSYDNAYYCLDCYNELLECPRCHTLVSDLNVLHYHPHYHKETTTICRTCLIAMVTTKEALGCYSCNNYWTASSMTYEKSGNIGAYQTDDVPYCPRCLKDYAHCPKCNNFTYKPNLNRDITTPDGITITGVCNTCYVNNVHKTELRHAKSNRISWHEMVQSSLDNMIEVTSPPYAHTDLIDHPDDEPERDFDFDDNEYDPW